MDKNVALKRLLEKTVAFPRVKDAGVSYFVPSRSIAGGVNPSPT